jgi:hypothetical protein
MKQIYTTTKKLYRTNKIYEQIKNNLSNPLFGTN